MLHSELKEKTALSRIYKTRSQKTARLVFDKISFDEIN